MEFADFRFEKSGTNPAKPLPKLYAFSVYKMKAVEAIGNTLSRPTRKVPKPRSGHRCVANDSNLYSFGGYNPQILENDEDLSDDPNWPESRPLFRELWKFNIATKCWIKLKTVGFVPKALASHSASLYRNCLIVYGGTAAPFGSSSSNKIHLCNLSSLRWEEIQATGELPLEQYGQAVALRDNELFVVGGTTGFEYSIDVHCFNLDTFAWKEMKATQGRPRTRYRHEIACYGNKILVFGGGTAAVSFDFHELPSFDLRKQTWRKIVTHPDCQIRDRISPLGYPAPRRCHSLVHIDNNIFICGGYNGSEIFTDVWKFDLVTLLWKRLIVRVAVPTYFHSATVSPSGCMYVYGGVLNIRDNIRTGDVYQMWLKIPKLKEICWEALLHYQPRLPYLHSQVTLLEAGVPKEFVDRIEIPAEYG